MYAMRNLFSTGTCLALVLLVAGCVSVEVSTVSEDEVADAPSSESIVEKEPLPIRETKNVFYTGVVKPAGISIYNEGSHKLVLDDGRMILLESEEIDLNGYVDERVDVFGAIRPTVEGAGSIMRVERVKLVVEEEKQDVEDLGEELEKSETESQSESPLNIPSSSDGQGEGEEVSNEEVSTATSGDMVDENVEIVQETNDSPVSISPELMARIEKMAAHKTDVAEWTQQYCSSQIKFCFPIHRNWWYTSYGATTSALWHMELSPEDMTDFSMGDSPIVLNLFGGSLAEQGHEDKQVLSAGDHITIYVDWNGYQYFTISGHSLLQSAITYLSENIRPYNGE